MLAQQARCVGRAVTRGRGICASRSQRNSLLQGDGKDRLGFHHGEELHGGFPELLMWMLLIIILLKLVLMML